MKGTNTILVSRYLYTIGVMTLITSFVWMGLGIFSAIAKPPESEIKKEILAPINPAIDMATVEALSQRRQVSTDIDLQTLLEAKVAAGPTPSLAPLSTNSVTTENASESGSL